MTSNQKPMLRNVAQTLSDIPVNQSVINAIDVEGRTAV